MSNLKIPPSIILPRDWFQVGRRIEISTKEMPKTEIVLGVSVEKGNDFERASYSVVG
jgi:hypothetical protein